MSRSFLLIVFILTFTNFSYAQVRATTESGNRVLLFDNGTWKYDEHPVQAATDTALTTEAGAVVVVEVDTTKIVETESNEFFYLPSPRLVRYFGESGGKIRCRLSFSNNLGLVKIHFLWEFPIKDCERYFGWFKEGSKVIFTMYDNQTVEVVMSK